MALAAAFAAANAAAELGDRLVEGSPVPEVQLLEGARDAPVAVEGVALVARAVAHPLIATVVREGDGDERGAQIVNPDRLAYGAPLKELLAGYLGEMQIVAEGVDEILGVNRRPLPVHEDRIGRLRVRVQLSPRLETPPDALIEGHGARIVRLVAVDEGDPAAKVDARPGQGRDVAEGLAVIADGVLHVFHLAAEGLLLPPPHAV